MQMISTPAYSRQSGEAPEPHTQLPLMAHLVLGYPTLPESIRTAERYIAAGMGILELQIPFSHPTADGPVITEACRTAVEQQQVTVAASLQAISELREKYPQQEIIVMSYLNRVYAYGPNRFFETLKALGIRHVIVPDLPVPGAGDSEKQFAFTNSKELVPVLAANTPDSRLDQILAAGYDFFYLMSDFKITGSTFSLHPKLQQMAKRIRAHTPGARIGIGFGISTPEQVFTVLEVADYAIIGSALIRAQQEGRLNEYLNQLKNTPRPTTPTARNLFSPEIPNDSQ